jgi:glycosyltransferase involved in cell wall biosynthesis
MIIGIDGNEANVEKRVGIGEYAYELLRQFAERREENIDFRIYLKTDPLPHMPRVHDRFTYRIISPGKLWTQWRLPLDLYIHKPRVNVFFTPSHYAPRFSPMPTVISVMDLSYMFFPELFNKSDLYQLKNWTSYSVKKAKKVLTISNSSKNDIIKEYNIASGKVVVTYPGVREADSLTPQIYSMNQIKNTHNISGNYILFVGTLQPRKNIIKLMEAFSHVASSEKSPKDLQLVIIGKKGWLYEEILNAPEKYDITDKVVFLDSITNEDLPLFYKNALCMVLPSLYEGFGLPVLEAMKYDCPVIASSVSSLPEAGGEACLYINPEDTADMSEKITSLITNENLRKELIEKGRAQVKKFSWQKTAKDTLEILKEVAV